MCSNEGVPDRANGLSHSEEGKLPRNQKDDGEDFGRIEGAQARALAQHAFTKWQNWGSSDLRALSFPSFPHLQSLNLRHLNMSFAGARQFVASNNIFNEAKTVSGMFSHQAS